MLYASAAIGPLGGLSVLTFAPTLQRELGADLGAVLQSITVFMVPFTIGQLFSGALSDVIPRRTTFRIGMALTAAASVGVALAWDVPSFLTFRMFQGVGYAFVSPVVVALLGDLTTDQNRGNAMGLMGAAVTGGIATGPLLGGWLDSFGLWRVMFVYMAAHSLVCLVLFGIAFRHHPQPVPQGDGLDTIAELFGRLARLAARPPMQALSVAGFCAFVGFIALIAFLPDHLTALGHTPLEVGAVLSVAGLVGIPASVMGGRAVSRIGRRPVALAGFVGAALTEFCLTLALPYHLPLWAYAAAVGGVGLSVAMLWAATLTLSVEVDPQARGTTSSIFQFSRFLGFSLTPLLLQHPYQTQGLGAVLAVATGMLFVGAAAIILLRHVGAPMASRSRSLAASEVGPG